MQVEGRPLAGLHAQLPLVHQILHEQADVPLVVQRPAGPPGELGKPGAYRPADLAEVHGLCDQVPDLSGPAAHQLLVGVDEGADLSSGAHPLVSHDVSSGKSG